MKGLSGLQPAEAIAAMQAIARAVFNPPFAAGFFGTPALCLLVMLNLPWRWHEPGAAHLLAGGALYIAGTLPVTVLGNVPLNEALAAVAPADPDGAARWRSYLSSWTAWNHVRTAAALAAAALMTVAIYLQGRGPGAA